jgi:hypothetical protein
VCGVGGDDTQVTGKVYVMKDDVGRTWRNVGFIHYIRTFSIITTHNAT